MGLHQRHTHGRVFRGEDAREQLRIRKRDSHGDSIILHVPEGFAQKQVVSGDGSDTAASVVYVTLPQTFSGPAMYSTLTGDYYPEATEAPTSTLDNSPNFYTGPASSRSRHTSTESAATETSTAAATSTVVPQSSTPGAQKTVVGGTPIQATRAATATSTASPDSQDAGLSGGAKAGLAIGIILAIGLVCGLVFFCWRRKKSGNHQEALNEKHGSFADVGARRAEANGMSHGMAGGMVAGGTVEAAAAANRRDSSMTEKVPSSLRSTRTASTAPRLSLRPVTQFLPILGDNKSHGNVHGGSAWERNQNANGSDPFADASESRPETARSNPFDEQRRSNEPRNVAGGSGVAADAAHASPKASWEGSEPATPNNAQFGTAGGANGAPAPRQSNNVHRVQLDFKPSMDDELELVSGALVRLLHEYDDGWVSALYLHVSTTIANNSQALCISMDRSKQGVAPRTCLSKLPVKPRPQGPPPPQGYRPGPGQQQGPPRGPPRGARRPSNPPAPNGLPGAMQTRPLTPPSTRTPSPTEQRTDGVISTSPVGSQAPKRKPVPGMAM